MPLNNYADLENLDVASIRRLLDPNFDRSEVNRIAAERSLGGGGFSGARGNRLLESEITARALQGHSMLTPYLQMEQQRNLQTQSEASALQRQVAQNNAEIERLTLQQNHATASQLREIEARKQELERNNAAAMERLQLNERGATERQAMGEQGANARQATGIEADLRLARERAGLGTPPTQFRNQAPVGITPGANPVSTQRGSPSGPSLPSGPNSATLAAIQQLTSGFGNSNPSLMNPNAALRTTITGNPIPQSGTNYTASLTNYGGRSGPVTGNYQDSFTNAPDPFTYDWAGIDNINQPVWQSGSSPNELVWGGVDSQIKNKNTWTDSQQFDPSLYA